MPPDATFPPIKKISATNFKHILSSRFFVKLHMTLMLGAVMISGVGASKLLLELEINSMLIRYPIAVCVAYGIFFFSIKTWLWHIGLDSRRKDESDDEDLEDLIDSDRETTDIRSHEGGGIEPHWTDSVRGSKTHYENNSTSGSSSDGSVFDLAPDFDLGDEGGAVIIVLALLGFLLLSVFGVGIFLIYQSPVILAEAAFQAALASGLISATRRIEGGDWASSVFRSTWIPFAAVLALAIGFGWAARHYCPAATKAAEIFYLCR